VPATSLPSIAATSEAKLKVRKYHLRIVLKMLFIVFSSNKAKAMTLKCLWKRGVMKVLPPPGGPIAEIIIVSMIVRNGCLGSLRSYQPPESTNCLRISIGG